ncbi:MAG: hypothetical protein J5J06_00225 [Phycisphaerae bacterium]|nr:hypothetical protein [Phycisphaerae bacterium]
MNTKQRDVVFQRWSNAIRREARDSASLEQVGVRALADTDVHDDPTLQSMIQAELQKRRAELEQESQDQGAAPTPSEPRQDRTPSLPETVPRTTPEPDLVNFNRLVLTLSTSLERGNEKETRITFAKMRALQQRSPEVIPAPVIEEYAQRVERLQLHIRQLADEIVALAERAVVASRKGNERDLARTMRRLAAIHAAHPGLLDEPGLEDIRRDVINAADERLQYQLTTKKLLERERAITAEVRTHAAAVREFHRVACAVPDTAEEFREAEIGYLRAIQKIRACDGEWFTGIVLELADLLAEWSVPPLGAKGQIDRFLDGIDAGLNRIRMEMREIDSEQASNERNESGTVEK